MSELRTSGGDHRLVRHGRATLRVVEHCDDARTNTGQLVGTHARIHGKSRHEAHARPLLFELRVVREHVHRERVVPARARRLEPIHTLQVRGEKGSKEQRTLRG